MKADTVFYYCICLVVVLLSYFHYSSVYYPFLNSDDAVSILMLHYFDIKKDLYFWGQDRYGSLIPLTGQVLHQIFGLKAILAESLMHYAILIVGCAGFLSLINSRILKLVFLIVWFFPVVRMMDLLRYNIGIEYSLLGIAILIVGKIRNADANPNGSWKIHIYFILFFITALSAVWVSELAIVTFSVLLFLFWLFKSRHQFKIPVQFKMFRFYFPLLIGAGFSFLYYAKSNSVKVTGYSAFNLMYEIINSFAAFIKYLVEFFTFKADEPFTSIYVWLLFIAIVVIFNKVKWRSPLNSFWLTFFILNSGVIFLVLLTSHWVFSNDLARRYFVPLYIMLWMVLLLMLDQKQHMFGYTKHMLLTIVIIGGLGPVYKMKCTAPVFQMPRAEIASEFKQLGEIGIIAEYWNSYINSCVDPDNIIATPHDKSQYRNTWMTEKVFTQKNIYIIRDMWMKDFPDTLIQFDKRLIRSGEPFSIGDSQTCRYELR